MAFKVSNQYIAIFALASIASAGILPAAQVYHAAPAAQVLHAAPATQVYHAGPAAQVYHAGPSAQVLHSAPAQIYQSGPAIVKAAQLTVAQPVLAKHNDEYDPHPQYNFAYEIQDGLSGDSKSQIESRDGDVVKGQYSLIDADGYKRTVDYVADPVNGFNAVVNREPLVVKSAAPAIVKAAPLAYAAGPAPLAYAAAPSAIVKTVSPLAYAAGPAILKANAPYTIAHH